MSASELKRTFDLASLHFTAARNLSGDDWHSYRAIKARHDSERAAIERSYRQEYETRVEAARADLLHKAAHKSWDHQPNFGRRDRFDAGALERQAHRQVREEHLADLARQEERACDDLRALLGPSTSQREAGAPSRERETGIVAGEGFSEKPRQRPRSR